MAKAKKTQTPKTSKKKEPSLQEIIKEDQIKYRKVRNYLDTPNRFPLQVQSEILEAPATDFRFESPSAFNYQHTNDLPLKQKKQLRKYRSLPELRTNPHSLSLRLLFGSSCLL